MLHIKAPNPLPARPGPVVFLAGSIEQGTATQWQDMVAKYIGDEYGILLNPRRDDWDASWVQEIGNDQFRGQVEWELSGLEQSDIVFFYFDPKTKSPITLMELGFMSQRWSHVIVCCPSGFWRKGNVDIMCDRYNIRRTEFLDEAIDMLIEEIEKYVPVV